MLQEGARDLSARCAKTSPAGWEALLEELRRLTDIEPPCSPPAQFRPMSWSDARAAEQYVVDFGIHDHSSEAVLPYRREPWEKEIMDCWERLLEEVANPLLVLAYPFGQPMDFRVREMQNVGRLGLLGL